VFFGGNVSFEEAEFSGSQVDLRGARSSGGRVDFSGANEPLAELAAYFRANAKLPDEDLVRLTLAARAAGSRWDDIVAGCGITTYKDLGDVIYRITGESGAELLFSATQNAVGQLTDSERRYLPLTWACGGCGQRVTDRAPAGRAVHVEHGHGPGCSRLARDQAAEDTRRRAQVPGPDLGFRTRRRPGAAALAARADHLSRCLFRDGQAVLQAGVAELVDRSDRAQDAAAACVFEEPHKTNRRPVRCSELYKSEGGWP
jgi:hypothetical protein